ncbi:alpha/beta hydrolase [Mucilaginibacter aquaedulcis]|uniref:alpha/beta hydrolase n=1 Tax=Mucilaginibacter aquaedulcis TaxID=1187081 RepID=UPI0025B2E7D1|nr:alpha/beta hydrolase [Mucilaginibacter aquaedulcis]MDN3548890.1 alpha/beta hydrolase [Mucilaginibacter aquaedulcis]
MKQQIKTIKAIITGLLITSGVYAQRIDVPQDPQIESHVKVFLKAVNSSPGKPIEQLSPKDGRAVLVSVQKSVNVDLSGIVISEKLIKIKGEQIKLDIVRPIGAKGILPAFMFFHGGGWVLGDFETHKRLVRDLVVNSGAVAVFVNYSPSPEAHFPVAINQAYLATEWVAVHSKELNIDGRRLAVAGNSVGGNMAAVVALMAKDRKGPAIRFQLLLWPVTDADFNTPSYNQYAEKRFLTKSVMEYYWNSYIPNPADRKNKYASPLQATLAELSGLPPAFIQVAENDVLRDEGEAYGRKLDEAGVPVTVVRYNGLIHDYGLLNPLAAVPSIRSAMNQAGVEIKNHLK